MLTCAPACLLQQCSEAIRRELFQERTAVLKAQADEAAAAQKALQEKEFRWVQADRPCLAESHPAAAGGAPSGFCCLLRCMVPACSWCVECCVQVGCCSVGQGGERGQQGPDGMICLVDAV